MIEILQQAAGDQYLVANLHGTNDEIQRGLMALTNDLATSFLATPKQHKRRKVSRRPDHTNRRHEITVEQQHRSKMTLHVALTHRTSYRYDRRIAVNPQVIRTAAGAALPHANSQLLAVVIPDATFYQLAAGPIRELSGPGCHFLRRRPSYR